jgi:hypothetical protein
MNDGCDGGKRGNVEMARYKIVWHMRINRCRRLNKAL